jgi:hypothetical protein
MCLGPARPPVCGGLLLLCSHIRTLVFTDTVSWKPAALSLRWPDPPCRPTAALTLMPRRAAGQQGHVYIVRLYRAIRRPAAALLASTPSD